MAVQGQRKPQEMIRIHVGYGVHIHSCVDYIYIQYSSLYMFMIYAYIIYRLLGFWANYDNGI
jgi:hypothetical protein